VEGSLDPIQMKRFMMLFATLVIVAFVPSAGAASGALFGTATMDGNQVKLLSDFSDTSTTNDSGGINFTDTGVTTFSSLTELATKFNVTDDGCGGGSPRFQLNIAGKNVFVYLGPSPSFTGCTPNTLVDSGNLIGNNDACRYDTSQISPGTQCNTYAGTLALVGSQAVTGIQLVVDGGWFFTTDKEQTVNVCDIRINNATVFPCQGKGGGGGGANKITICHHTKHKSTGATKHVTIKISQSAWPAHQKHGDTMGACTTQANLKAHSKAAHVKKFHKKASKSKGKGKGGR
jgi:hypothetical protein